MKEYQLIVEFGERNIPSALEEQKKEAFLEGQDESTIRPIFKEEMKHCKQMIQLLPEKINRLHYFNQDISDWRKKWGNRVRKYGNLPEVPSV